MNAILLCSDLDRTLILNGHVEESSQARSLFAYLATYPKLRLAYVSGRRTRLIQEAIETFDLPEPDFVIGDVGTTIIQIVGGRWIESRQWQKKISQDCCGFNRNKIRQLLSKLENIDVHLQPPENQNENKLSYFTRLTQVPGKLKNKVAGILGNHGISANLIWSRDDIEQRGLFDILPTTANKLLAIRFLMIENKFDSLRTAFAGDSGNDLDALTSGLPAILVKNASPDVRQAALDKLTSMGLQNRLYMAKGNYMDMNGNYAAGVLEGMAHFFPEISNWLEYWLAYV